MNIIEACDRMNADEHDREVAALRAQVEALTAANVILSSSINGFAQEIGFSNEGQLAHQARASDLEAKLAAFTAPVDVEAEVNRRAREAYLAAGRQEVNAWLLPHVEREAQLARRVSELEKVAGVVQAVADMSKPPRLEVDALVARVAAQDAEIRDYEATVARLNVGRDRIAAAGFEAATALVGAKRGGATAEEIAADLVKALHASGLSDPATRPAYERERLTKACTDVDAMAEDAARAILAPLREDVDDAARRLGLCDLNAGSEAWRAREALFEALGRYCGVATEPDGATIAEVFDRRPAEAGGAFPLVTPPVVADVENDGDRGPRSSCCCSSGASGGRGMHDKGSPGCMFEVRA